MLFEGKIITVNVHGTKFQVTLRSMKYQNDRLAIVGTLGDIEDFGVLSVNIPDQPLKENEVLIKNWSENEAYAEAARNSGFFKDTGRRVKTGFCEAEIWEVL
jgi:hypothetical protein